MAEAKSANAKSQEEEQAVPHKMHVKNSPFSDVVYKELSRINGKINQMNKTSVIDKLNKFRLSTDGTTEVLKKRLKNYYKQQKLSKANLLTVSKLLPYYIIIDFEATCQEVNGPDYVHEIIEFPAVLVNTESQEIVDHFQAFCKPTLAPLLTDFCSELTGITQEQIDVAPTFPDVFDTFQAWMKKHKLGSKYKFAIVADGPWDMGRFLNGQCNISNVKYPSYARKWINLRKAFSNFYKCKRHCLRLMLSHLGMEFEGRPHCGLDDARNIARVLLRMMSDGATVQVNERIYWRRHDREQAQVVSLNPPEKMRDIKQVHRQRSTIKDLSIFELSNTDDSQGEESVDKDLNEDVLLERLSKLDLPFGTM